MLVEDIQYTESLEFIDSTMYVLFDKMWKREGIKGTSCPKNLMKEYSKRMFFYLLSIDTPLHSIPICSNFQRIDWRNYEEEYNFTLQSKLITSEEE